MRPGLFACWLLLALATPAVAQGAGTTPSVHTFARIEGRELELDFHASLSEAPAPLVIWMYLSF